MSEKGRKKGDLNPKWKLPHFCNPNFEGKGVPEMIQLCPKFNLLKTGMLGWNLDQKKWMASLTKIVHGLKTIFGGAEFCSGTHSETLMLSCTL